MDSIVTKKLDQCKAIIFRISYFDTDHGFQFKIFADANDTIGTMYVITFEDMTPAAVNHIASGNAQYVENGWYAVCTECGKTFGEALTEGSGYTFTVTSENGLASALSLDGANIILASDITGTFEISYEITIDLAGYTISNADGDSTHTITVRSDGKLTITDSGHVKNTETVYGTVDSVVNDCAALYVEVGGEATLNGGKYERSQEAGSGYFDYDDTYEYVGSSNGNSYYTIVNHGKMLINGGVTVINSGSYSSTIENGWYYPDENTTNATASLTIGGGTFSGGVNTVKNDDCGELTIYDGEFTNSTMYVVMNWNTATIEGGSFESLGGYDVIVNFGGTLAIGGGTFEATKYAVVLESDSNNEKTPEVVITGGTFIGTDEAMVIAIYAGTLKISGGTFVAANYEEGDGNDDENKTYYYYDVLYAWGGAEITVSGGVFEGWMETEDDGTISITGGYFTLNPSNYDDVSYVAEGYTAKATEFNVEGETYTMYVVASEENGSGNDAN